MKQNKIYQVVSYDKEMIAGGYGDENSTTTSDFKTAIKRYKELRYYQDSKQVVELRIYYGTQEEFDEGLSDYNIIYQKIGK